MYHHFAGKQELALAAIRRSAEELRAAADAQLSGPGRPADRIAAYLRRERDVLAGCPIGRLAYDPEVLATPALREPVQETFAWLRGRLADVVREGPARDPDAVAAAIIAALQGGYVLARAAGTTEPFDQAMAGVLALLAEE
jgi:AcrR family transcriptional regulator